MRIEVGQVPQATAFAEYTDTTQVGSRGFPFYCPVVSLEVSVLRVLGAEAEARRQRGGQHGRGVVMVVAVVEGPRLLRDGGLLDGVLQRPHEREEERLVGLWSRIQR